MLSWDSGNQSSTSAAVSPSTAGGGLQPAEGTSCQVQELLGCGTHETAMGVVPKSLESNTKCCVGVCPSS